MPSTTSSPEISSVRIASLANTARAMRIRHADELNLADHDGSGCARRKAPSLPGHPRRVRGRCDDAWFLDGHRDEVVTPVDPEVHGDAERNRHRAHDVLDHSVHLVELQGARVPDRFDFCVRQIAERPDDLPSILRALLVKSGYVGALDQGPAPVRSSLE